MESSPSTNVAEPTMKPTTSIVADVSFPEGAGIQMEFEDAGGASRLLVDLNGNKKTAHADKSTTDADKSSMEINPLLYKDAGGTFRLLADLDANKQTLHAGFFNDFGDLYDDDDLN